MAGMNVEHINPFLIAATKVLKDACYIDVKVGRPSIQTLQCQADTLTISIGVIGEMKGQVKIALTNKVALDIASKMCMMPMTQIDEMSMSAISELGNMIMGNAATVFSSKGIGIDITTPKIETGASQANGNQYMNIPLLYEADKGLDMYLAVTG